MKLLEALRRFVNPEGPIGEVISPSEVYKTRLGLPVSSPHQVRVSIEAPSHASAVVEATAARFVPAAEADVPKSRERQVSAFLTEHWSPVYAKTDSTDMVEILRASQTLLGWTVTPRVAASAKAKMTAEQFAEVLQSAQIQASDEIYNGFYETISGPDSILVDGKMLTGGTRITGGRREYAEKTKNFVHWGPGVAEKHAAAHAELDSRPVRNVKRALEAHAGVALPLYRRLQNGRYDRRSAV